MHELGILYHVVTQVVQIAKDNQLSQVETLVLQVGETSPVIPRYLQACFPAATDGTLLEKTKLQIEVLPANGLCAACGKVFPLLKNNKTCPQCGGQAYEQLSGNEFYIKEIIAC